MGTAACSFKLPDNTGLCLQGKNRRASYAPDTTRAAFVFSVDSTAATHERLKAAGGKSIHAEPRRMGGDNYRFQFYDPAGNILEVLGGK
jgi:predicted enzyme related to lactoylglutathione lyase